MIFRFRLDYGTSKDPMNPHQEWIHCRLQCDPSDLGSLIHLPDLDQFIPKKYTLYRVVKISRQPGHFTGYFETVPVTPNVSKSVLNEVILEK